MRTRVLLVALMVASTTPVAYGVAVGAVDNLACDFDGNGKADLVVGVPAEDIKNESIGSAGIVHVIYGKGVGLTSNKSQVWHKDVSGIKGTAIAEGRFGEYFDCGDFDADGFADLAVSSNNAFFNHMGEVNVLYGGPNGLKSGRNQLWHRDKGLKGDRAAGDGWGRSLRSGDFNGDGYDDLAVGAPLDSHTTFAAGSVSIIFGSADGLAAADNQLYWPQKAGIKTDIPLDKQWGTTLEAADFDGDGRDDLAVGAPFANAPGPNNTQIQNTGAVQIIYGGDDGLTFRDKVFNRTTLKGALEANQYLSNSMAAGDVNGDGYADLAVGVRELIGAVNVIYGTADGLKKGGNQRWHRGNTIGSGDSAFGQSIVIGNFDGDEYDDLAIGVPGYVVGGTSIGAVKVLYGTSNGAARSGEQLWHRAKKGVVGPGKFADQFGGRVAAGDFDGNGKTDLAVTAEGHDVGTNEVAGSVNVIYGKASGLVKAGDQIWHQNSPGIANRAEPLDGFGRGLGNNSPAVS